MTTDYNEPRDNNETIEKFLKNCLAFLKEKKFMHGPMIISNLEDNFVLVI